MPQTIGTMFVVIPVALIWTGNMTASRPAMNNKKRSWRFILATARRVTQNDNTEQKKSENWSAPYGATHVRYLDHVDMSHQWYSYSGIHRQQVSTPTSQKNTSMHTEKQAPYGTASRLVVKVFKNLFAEETPEVWRSRDAKRGRILNIKNLSSSNLDIVLAWSVTIHH